MSDKKILVGDMSRETAIGILKLMLEAMEVYDSIAPTPQRRNAVQMAISSLETDEAYQLEYESTTRNCFECKYSKDNHNSGTEECHLCMWENQYTPTTKNDLEVDFKLKDYVSREAVRRIIKSPRTQEQMLNALNSLRSIRSENTVSLSAYKQVAWERDIAIEQLKELGYEFGEKIVNPGKDNNTTIKEKPVENINISQMIEDLKEIGGDSFECKLNYWKAGVLYAIKISIEEVEDE